MKKSAFVNLIIGTIGGLLFALGMCMCLLPEWNAFKPGVVVTALGLVMLAVLGLVCWIRAGRPVAKINWALTGKVAYCVAAALVLGAGMAMIMAFEGLMLPGVVVGVAGILMALFAVPVCKGLK